MSTETEPVGLGPVPTMNSVEPPPTSTTRYGAGLGQARGRAEELEPGLLLAASSSGRTPSDLLGGVEEVVAVRRVARRAGRRRAHALDAEVVDHLAVLAQRRERALDRVGMQAARSRSTP